MRITPIALRLCLAALVVLGLLQLPAFALSVRDHGAIPDDGRDDTVTFLAAFRAAADRKGEIRIQIHPRSAQYERGREKRFS